MVHFYYQFIVKLLCYLDEDAPVDARFIAAAARFSVATSCCCLLMSTRCNGEDRDKIKNDGWLLRTHCGFTAARCIYILYAGSGRNSRVMVLEDCRVRVVTK